MRSDGASDRIEYAWPVFELAMDLFVEQGMWLGNCQVMLLMSCLYVESSVFGIPVSLS